MSATPDLYFLEQTDFSVRLARCSVHDRSLSINELKEVPADQAAGLLGSLPDGATVLCAARPKLRALHLATLDEARRFSGPIGLRKFGEICSVSNKSMTWLAAVHARDGGPPSNTPWILSGAADVDPLATGTLEGLSIKPVRSISATLLTAGALAASAEQAVLMVEIGELVSHAMLISREGVLAAGAISLDLSRIAEAIQAELKLKFRGSAAKLFLNPDYDFTEPGPKVAARLAEALKSELARFVVDRPAPTALFVSGLPATQQWFGPELATALGLGFQAPDLQAMASAAGLKLAATAAPLPLPSAWLAIFHFIKLHSESSPSANSPWEADWTSLAAPVPAVTAEPKGPPRDEPVAGTEPARAPAPPPPPVSSPVAKAPPVQPTPPPVAAPAKKSLIAAAYSAQSSAKADPAASAPQPVAPAAAKMAASTPGKPSTQAPTKPPFSSVPFPPRKRRRPSRLVIILVILAAATLSIFAYRYFQHAKAEQLAAEKTAVELRLKSDEAKARLAARKAEEAVELQRQREAETAQKAAEEEQARRQAEENARAQAAARLANARGTIVVATNPTGASVTVGTWPSRTSPARFSDLKVGTYPVVISLAGHEDAHFELTVQENATTDAGVVTLMPLMGSLKISSEPAAAHYELHPANALMPSPETRRTGETPAAIDDLLAGDYDVTLTREGWAPHTQVVSISRNATTYLRWSWPNALVKINSDPAGAEVIRDGKSLGITPLTLTDQTPGDARYDLALDHFDPVPLTAKLEAGQATSLEVTFKPEDRVFTAQEVDRKPEPIGSKQPELPYYLTLESGHVELQLTVKRDGTTKNVTVVQATNPELGKYCAASVAKWQFKPGSKAGSPVNVSLRIPFVFKGK
jgi:TonB family protein